MFSLCSTSISDTMVPSLATTVTFKNTDTCPRLKGTTGDCRGERHGGA